MNPSLTPSPLALELLAADIRRQGVALEAEAWEALVKRCSGFQCARGEVVFAISEVPKHLLFVASGIAAAEWAMPDGRTIIHRFFERAQWCTTITSAIGGVETSDTIVAVAEMQGLLIPLEHWREAYLLDDQVGLYFRHRMLAHLLYAKELIRVKTLNSTEASHRFLQEHHPQVLAEVRQKDIARFMGITPEALSRFLGRRRSG
ncbi:MAG: cyclic nucleotide-binding domain-containing protein [Myxococcota bacterium]